MDWVAPTLGATVGLALGSFAATAGMRYARGQSFTRGGSRCDGCGEALGFLRTTPLISYVGLRGACDRCGARIDAAHPLGEAAGALVVGSAVLLDSPLRAALVAILGLCLIASSVVDGRTQRLPDALTAAVAACALGLGIERGFDGLVVGLASSLAAMTVLQGLRWVSGHGGRDPGLGLGDVKLVGALAIWLGVLTPAMIGIAAVLGLLGTFAIVRARRTSFGPYLSVAALVVGIGAELAIWPPMI